MENKKPSLWYSSLVFSVMIYLVLSFYSFIRSGHYELYVANRLFADTAMVLIGISFALSGVGYFFHFNKYFKYRKFIGVIGFYYALIHGILSLFFLPERFPFPSYYFMRDNLLPFIFALVSLLILFMMTVISNKYFSEKIKGSLWRNLLRTGYIAYFFSLLHFGLKKYKMWISWLNKINNLPPLNLIIVVFALAVIILRVLLFINKHRE